MFALVFSLTHSHSLSPTLLLSTIFFYWWVHSHVEIIKGNKTWKLFSFVRIASLTSLIALGLRLNTNYENYLNCFGSCQIHLFQDNNFSSKLLIVIFHLLEKMNWISWFCLFNVRQTPKLCTLFIKYCYKMIGRIDDLRIIHLIDLICLNLSKEIW